MKIRFSPMLFVIAFLSLFLFCGNLCAITTETKSSGFRGIEIQEKRPIFFLSWDNNYLRTTQGTIYLKAVEVHNHTGQSKSELNKTSHPPEVTFKFEGNRVVQVDIYPSTK